MMRKPFLLLLCLVIMLIMAACSSDGRKPEYYDAEEAPKLVIPDGMDRPSSSSALVIRSPVIPPYSSQMETKPPRISSTTSGIDSNSKLNWSAQGMYLLVEDSAESANRRLGLVVQRSGMRKVEIDDQGVYRFEYYQVFQKEDKGFFSSLAFWRRDKREDYSGAYQVFARPDGENTRIYIKYADGTDCEPDAAEHVLAVLAERLG